MDWKKLIENLNNAPFDAILITSEQNRRYVTGFHSSAGVAIITKHKNYFFTDFRYIEAAKTTIENFDVREMKRGESYSDVVNEIIKQQKIKKIALEENSLTHTEFCSWEKKLNAQNIYIGRFLSELREIKSAQEVEKIVNAQRIAECAFEEILPIIKPGVTEKYVASMLTYLMLSKGAENMSFDPIVVSGKKSSMPHGVPDGKIIENGDFVTMDFGCIFDGYCSDMTRTVAVGFATEEMKKVYDIVRKAQNAGINKAKAGIKGKEVDLAARQVIENEGYGDNFGHGFGHGIGIDIHETPNAGLFSENILQEGNIISAEPGIYIPDKFGVRIEDMLLIKSDCNIDLTKTSKDLIILS